jgi:hypothetical protein
MNDTAQSPTELLDETVPEANAETATENASGETQVEQSAEEKTQAAAVEEEKLVEAKKQSRFARQQARFDAQLAEQQREIEFLRKLAVGVEPSAPVDSGLQEPKLEDFEGRSITEYIAARDRFLETKLITAAEQRARDAFAQEQHRIEMEKRVAEARRDLTDWDEVMAAANDDPVLPLNETVQIIVESEHGARIGYYLAKNPDEHEKLNRLSGVRRIAELARLEDRVRPQAEKPTTARAARKVSSAPAKLTETRGSASLNPMDPAAAARQGYAAWKVANEARRAAAKK